MFPRYALAAARGPSCLLRLPARCLGDSSSSPLTKHPQGVLHWYGATALMAVPRVGGFRVLANC